MSFIPTEVTSVFDVQNIINSGAYGSVIKVMKKSNQKHYAMKVITIDPRDIKSVKNAESELQVLLEIKNPYIVNLDSYFKEEDKVYLVIDYCPNLDLLRCIANKKWENQDFEEDEIWKYFIQASFGVEALHSNGFIHRDIKPENILIDEYKEVKLADFGLSRSLEATSVRGTLPYYSPRMCRGEIPTKESDIWALGCVLYYLCNLDIPFNGNIGKIQNEPYMPIKSQYSKELKYFVDWCLKKERNERPTINEILTHEFVVEKAIRLGIRIPKTSAMNIFLIKLLEKEKNFKNKPSDENNKNEEIEGLKAKIDALKGIIAEASNDIEIIKLKAKDIAKFLEKSPKNLNGKQLADVKNSIRALIADAEKIKKTFNYSEQLPKESEASQIQNPNINAKQNAKGKKSEIKKNPTSSKLEEGSLQSSSIVQAYQNNANTYKSSIFNVTKKDNQTNLLIYNTETETQESYILQTSQTLDWGTCITQLPNGKLFCFGKRETSGITLLIDENYKVEDLPSGTACSWSSAIYFNNNMYCFGGKNSNLEALALSSRFDLGRNQWINLAPLPQADWSCNSVIFNWSILISGCWNKNILRYVIDSNSFFTIPYDFAEDKRKILINTERLYLIECQNGSIYESEIGIDTAWRRIANSSIVYDQYQVYWQYNNGEIYIGCLDSRWSFECFKFNLKEKRLTQLV